MIVIIAHKQEGGAKPLPLVYALQLFLAHYIEAHARIKP